MVNIENTKQIILNSVSQRQKCNNHVDNVACTNYGINGHDFSLHLSKRCITTSTAYSSRIGTPLENDILFGRGHHVSRHIGNVRFRELIYRMKPLYNFVNSKISKTTATSKFKQRKTVFIDNLVKHVVSCGGRFLERDNNNEAWVHADNLKVRVKVGQALRDTMI